MDERYFIYSRITGKNYNVFEAIRIVNIKQSMAYISNGILPVDLKIEKDNKTCKPCLVFYFIKQDTSELYERWCNHELEINDETMWN